MFILQLLPYPNHIQLLILLLQVEEMEAVTGVEVEALVVWLQEQLQLLQEQFIQLALAQALQLLHLELLEEMEALQHLQD